MKKTAQKLMRGALPRQDRLEDDDRCPNSSECVDALEVAIIQPDAAMRNIFPQEARVERAVDEIALPESQRVLAQHSLLNTVGLVCWNLLTFFDEGPIRLYPSGMSELGLHEKFSAGGVKHPLVIALTRFIKDGSASCRGNGVKHDFLPAFDIQMVTSRIDENVRLMWFEPGELLGQRFILCLEALEMMAACFGRCGRREWL